MLMDAPEIVVAGHICLDLFPTFPNNERTNQLIPGSLVNVDQMFFAIGGAVSNTGLALQKLGMPVKLIGKIGDDIFGNLILDILAKEAKDLEKSLTVTQGATSSYSVVISQPSVDRIFLHCPGANDTFSADDINFEKIREAKFFHFGYPPIMQKIYRSNGAELVKIFTTAKSKNLTTSLDMTFPDAESESGKIDWLKFLSLVLPKTDIFLPSFDEALFMLDHSLFIKMTVENLLQDPKFFDLDLLNYLSEKFLTLGAAIVCLKMGSNGLYLRTTSNSEKLEKAGFAENRDEWLDREIYSTCFETKVIGTTGAGDCTIAGFLAAVARGRNPLQAVSFATAVGAASVESLSATRGVSSYITIENRMKNGWRKYPPPRVLSKDWIADVNEGVWIGKKDFLRRGQC